MSAMDPHTQERVYYSLKAEYLAGALRPGIPLELQDLADKLRVSKTPLREAVYRLLGERLLERQPGGGFILTPLRHDQLADLYRWNNTLVLEIVRHIPADRLRRMLSTLRIAPGAENSVELALFTGRIFLALASQLESQAAVETIIGLNERLHYARIGEAASVPDALREQRTLLDADARDLVRAFRRRVDSYHRRRIVWLNGDPELNSL